MKLIISYKCNLVVFSFFFSLLLLNWFYFCLHTFCSIFSACWSFSPPFFPISYFIVMIFAHFPSCFQYLQETLSSFLLLCSLSFLLFPLFWFWVRLSNLLPLHPSNLSNSSPRLYSFGFVRSALYPEGDKEHAEMRDVSLIWHCSAPK